MISGHLSADNSLQKALGERIRRARQARKLSIAKAAGLVAMHHSQLSRIERGEFRLAGKSVQKICSELGIEMESIDLEYLCDRVRRTIRTAQTERAMNAFLDAVESALRS